MAENTVLYRELNYKTEIGNPMQLGTTRLDGGINFALIVTERVKNCSLILYEKGTRKIVTEIVFTEEMRFGNIFAMLVKGISVNSFEYNYRVDNKIITDPYAALIHGAAMFGETNPEKKTSGFYNDKFDWSGDRRLNYEFSDSLIYRLHVRGFTMGRYSGTRKKGTFLGILDKMDYLKELGVTMIELMPAYEFNEVIQDIVSRYEPRINMSDEEMIKTRKVDFWGYRDADYFMPKVAYSSKKDSAGAIKEFKTMVRELHKNGIEVCMEFYFGREVTPSYMMDCFRHWVFHYHIDAIHCGMDQNVRGAISADPYLSRTKIISYGFDGDSHSKYKHLGEYNQVFMNTARKFLKGDEGQVNDMAFRFRYNKNYAAAINYIATNDSFTMMDMVSYEIKHNEENGEYNKDGSNYNYSWNCGYEGETKRKNVTALRRRQLKNAMAMLLLSQGTPLLYAGDEFGNSCGGNNNPYCQDNEVSYLDWRLVKKNSWLLEYTKSLIQYRKAHNILHMDQQLQVKDYHSLGMPDISYHSERTWSLDMDIFARCFGVMLNGSYCQLAGKNPEENLYIAFNMHWESRKLGIPTAGRNKKWKMDFTTADDIQELSEREPENQRYLTVPPRSVVVLSSVIDPEAEERERIMAEKLKAEDTGRQMNPNITNSTKKWAQKKKKVAEKIEKEDQYGK